MAEGGLCDFWMLHYLGVIEMFGHTVLAYEIFGRSVDINAIVSRHVETVCLLSNRKPDARVKIDVDLEDYYRIKDEQKKIKPQNEIKHRT